MKVQVVAITKPLITKDGLDAGLEPTQMTAMSANEFIAYCARVSNPSNQGNTETAGKLVTYLIRNKHWSPFEMVSLTMEINTTRDIARQILRHRSFSFQEFSTRYAAVDTEKAEIREARLQDTKNRQNSIEIEDEMLQREWELHQSMAWNASRSAYEWALEHGIAKEQARAVLPEGMTPSRLYMAGTLRSWIHYVELRADKGTQKEHRLIAEACKQQIITYFPSLQNYFNE
jgi:thymidylate synthase (FAD)